MADANEILDIQDEDKFRALARCAELAERWDDMCEFMTERVNLGTALSFEERELFAVAFKGCLQSRRYAAQVAKAEWQTAVVNQANEEVKMTMVFKTKIEEEVREICQQVGELLKRILPGAMGGETRTFFLKMQADFNRYYAEMCTGELRDQVIQEAETNYGEALKEATESLLYSHPLRLALALNVAVFQYELKDNRFAAQKIAKRTLREAVSELGNMPEEAQQAAAMTLQALQDNLDMWLEEDNDPKPPKKKKEDGRDSSDSETETEKKKRLEKEARSLSKQWN